MTENEELEMLKKLSPYSLPNNPSQQGWSASQIKEKFYKGLFFLYELFKDLRGEVETVISGEIITSVSIDEETQEITFGKLDGTTETFDLSGLGKSSVYDDTTVEEATTFHKNDIWLEGLN